MLWKLVLALVLIYLFICVRWVSVDGVRIMNVNIFGYLDFAFKYMLFKCDTEN